MEKIIFILSICLSIALITSGAPTKDEVVAPPSPPAEGPPKDLNTENTFGLGYGLAARSLYGGYGLGLYGGYGFGGYGYGGYGGPGYYGYGYGYPAYGYGGYRAFY